VAEIPPVSRPADSLSEPATPDTSAPAGQGLLSVRPIRALWMALSLSMLGDWLGLLAITALAASLASSSYFAAGAAVAAVFALRLVPALVLDPIARSVTGRLDRRWTMVAGDLARGALVASIPLVGRLWWLFAATFLIAIIGILVAAAWDGMAGRLVPRDRRGEAARLQAITIHAAALAAGVFFALLALLAGAFGAGIPFFRTQPVDLALYVTAATFLFAAVAAFSLPGTVAAGIEPPAGAIQTLLRSRPTSSRGTTGLLLGLLGALGAAAALVGVARIYVRDLGGGNAAYGVLFAAVLAGLALGMAGASRLLPRLSRRRLLGLTSVLVGIALVVLALVPNLVLVVLLAFLTGLLGGVAWTTAFALLRDEDDGRQTQLLPYAKAMLAVALVIIVALAPLLAGAIGVHRFSLTDAVSVDYNGAAVLLFVTGLVVLLVGLLAYQRIDDRRGTSVVGDLRTALRGRPMPTTGTTLGGYLIALEGGEGAGKSSQAERLASFLIDRGHEVVLTFEPGSTPVGRMLRMTLLDPAREGPSDRAEALLYAADRADHVHSIVRPALERGAIVITDRYSDSSIAYQGAGRALPADDIAHLSEWATAGLVPDITVLLDVAPEIGLARRGTELDRLESEPAEFHDRVRAEFLALARRHSERYVVVDASLPFEEAAVRIRQAVQNRVPLSPRERHEIEERWRRRGEERAQAEQEERRRAELEAERQRLEAEEARQRAEAEATALAEERQRREEEDTLRLRREEEDSRERVAETEASRQRLSDNDVRRRVAREEAFRYLYADTYDDGPGPPIRTQDDDLVDEIFGTSEEPSDGRPSPEGRHRATHPDTTDDPDEEHTQLLPRIDP
jgi:dTMP kinase